MVLDYIKALGYYKFGDTASALDMSWSSTDSGGGWE